MAKVQVVRKCMQHNQNNNNRNRVKELLSLQVHVVCTTYDKKKKRLIVDGCK